MAPQGPLASVNIYKQDQQTLFLSDKTNGSRGQVAIKVNGVIKIKGSPKSSGHQGHVSSRSSGHQGQRVINVCHTISRSQKGQWDIKVKRTSWSRSQRSMGHQDQVAIKVKWPSRSRGLYEDIPTSYVWVKPAIIGRGTWVSIWCHDLKGCSSGMF